MTSPLVDTCVLPNGRSVALLLVWILCPIISVCPGGLAGFVKRLLSRINRMGMKKRRLRNFVVILLHRWVVQPNGMVAIDPIVFHHDFCINAPTLTVERISDSGWKFAFDRNCAYH